MKKVITICLLVVTLIVGGMTIDAKTTKKGSKTKTTSTSKRSSSKGNDLGLFNVQGKVKSITYSEDNCLPSPFRSKKPILFSESGECSNLKELFKQTMGAEVVKVSFKRNTTGQISEIVGTINSFDDCTINFTWEGDLLKEYVTFDGYSSEDFSKLDYKDGRITYIDFDGGMSPLWHDSEYLFSDFIEDSFGNWIECTLKFNNTVGDMFEDETETTSKTIKLKRTITYY